MTKPLIGISCDFETYLLPEGTPEPRDRNYSKLCHYYYHALMNAGADCVLVPITREPQHAIDILPRLDGILLSGGDDYPPDSYHETPHPTVECVQPWRAGHDLTLARHLLERSDMPVFAICGGLQALVIADGGALIQDIPDQVKGSIAHRRVYHDVRIEPGSHLHELLGERTPVYSSHHQALKRAGSRLKPVAWAEDGVVEAVELREAERYLIAVQWHPEVMVKSEPMERVFRDFVQACENYSLRASCALPKTLLRDVVPAKAGIQSQPKVIAGTGFPPSRE
ncbi:MAG: gamma-glutamyl-gamma-aminobutyrate hydrolase family protein [Planctomycetaceae bacterium]|nr:gamma-glutamyl-gamma-aminobutyrate hydrolase family protein [Planctomycetaceae bacterium]